MWTINLSTRSTLSHMFKQQLELGNLEGNQPNLFLYTGAMPLAVNWIIYNFLQELLSKKEPIFHQNNTCLQTWKTSRFNMLPHSLHIAKNTYYHPRTSDFQGLLQATTGSRHKTWPDLHSTGSKEQKLSIHRNPIRSQIVTIRFQKKNTSTDLATPSAIMSAIRLSYQPQKENLENPADFQLFNFHIKFETGILWIIFFTTNRPYFS